MWFWGVQYFSLYPITVSLHNWQPVNSSLGILAIPVAIINSEGKQLFISISAELYEITNWSSRTSKPQIYSMFVSEMFHLWVSVVFFLHINVYTWYDLAVSNWHWSRVLKPILNMDVGDQMRDKLAKFRLIPVFLLHHHSLVACRKTEESEK